MNKKISNYYTHYLKGKYLAAQNNLADHRKAIVEFLQAIEIKKCLEVYVAILNSYIKLNDIDNVIKYSEMAFAYGDVAAMHFLGHIYYQDTFGKQNLEKAYNCFLKCIEKKFVPAYVSLAKMYLNGDYVAKDENKYLGYLKASLKIKNHGNIGEPLEELGVYYYKKGDYKVAVKYFKKSIKLYWEHSNYHLAICYRDGKGVKKDLNKYMDHLLRCSCKETYNELAKIYANNMFVESDQYLFETSIFYLANAGDSVGAIILAAIYSNKKPVDEAVVNYWLERGFSKVTKTKGLKEETFESIKSCVDSQFHDFIDEMANKYFATKRYDA